MTTLTHKICLDPTYKQGIYFAKASGIARFTWNWALAEWKRQYEEGSKPNALKLKKEFNAIKPNKFPWMYEVTKYASQQPFMFLQTAYRRFFQGISKYPQFKKKGVHDSFYIGNDHIQVKGKKIRLPKLGWVRMREALRFSGKIVSATVSKVVNRWFVSLNVELAIEPTVYKNQVNVGVDLGIKRLASLYNGEKHLDIEGPKPLKKLLRKLKCCQRRLSCKEKGSNNRNKQRLKLAILHARIRNIRCDGLHKLTSLLTKNSANIVIEDLNVKGMMKNHKLARSIADMGFYEFRRQLEYKTKLYGSELHIVDKWFPSTKKCSQCGKIKELITLSERTYQCEHCGLAIDRDHNAAINLFSTVSSTGFQACGEEGAGLSHPA